MGMVGLMSRSTWKISNVLFQAHVVAAFEQSLTNMTNRLQQLTASSEQKVGDISCLIKYISDLVSKCMYLNANEYILCF